MFLLPDDSWEVIKTKEKGAGVFSKEKISAGTVIGDYLGKVIRTAEYDLENDKAGLYLMYFTDNASLYPDLTKPGPHLLNHSCMPNCWVYIYQGHTLFFALRDIESGEELTISYLLNPNDGSCNQCTHICKCKSINCSGTMHLPNDKYRLWQTFQNRQRRQTKNARVVYGKNLPKLISYPKKIPSDPIYAVICSPIVTS